MKWLTDLIQQPAAIAIIAASLTFLAGIIINNMNQRAIEKKENRRWEHERELERDKMEHQKELAKQEELRVEKVHIHSIYHNCIRHLNTFISQQGGSRGLRDSPDIPEVHEWLSLLLLYLGNRDDSESENFRTLLQEFTGNPNLLIAGKLEEGVLKLALKDKLLFPN